MFLTQQRRDRAADDLKELVQTIKDPQERYYLKPTCVSALERLGHDRAVAEEVAAEFFKRTLQ